jgi:glycosyltransferase involved in cell wall biosynthesis
MTLRRRNPAALDNPKVSVVIPVYNEKDTILEILGHVLATDMAKEVIIVDAASKDGTWEILETMAAMQAKGRGNDGCPGRNRCNKSAGS